jgi:hypothetical protein
MTNKMISKESSNEEAANYEEKNTSLISILSSAHGRLRREQRDIDKRNLQRALKYGTCKTNWGGRWLVEYDGISFVTDPTKKHEITAFPSPLPEVDVENKALLANIKMKRLLEQKPDFSTSHTVIVIDNSGSMLSKKNDIHLYRDSQNAAFSMTALEFIAEQLLNNTAVNTDLVSLIKFDMKPSVEISREPISWPVYNKILAHRNTQYYKDREHAPFRDAMWGMSNYLPALEKVHQLLNEGYHDKLALSVYFFSDGESTDHMKLGVTGEESYQLMKNSIAALASSFGDSLTVSMVGLGDADDHFEPLQAMAKAAIESGAKGSFERCNKTALSISSSITSMVTSTMESRVALQQGGGKGHTERNLTSERESSTECMWNFYRIFGHRVYSPRLKDWVSHKTLPLAAISLNSDKAVEWIGSRPQYLAVNQNYAGKGAERVAFRCRLSYTESTKGFVFKEMIAKETKHEQRMNDRVDFHKGFAETQDLANYLASQFNEHLRGTPNYSPTETPQLHFLSCSVLQLKDSSCPIDGIRGVLVEKMLDTDRFCWTKWNDNNGSVHGQRRAHNPIDVDFELKEIRRGANKKLCALTEGDEDSDDEDSLSDLESDTHDQTGEVNSRKYNAIDPSDYLRECRYFDIIRGVAFGIISSLHCLLFALFFSAEAFTHFTYRFTRGRVMVCDLQGVFNTDMIPPTFELTDPAIHYTSNKGRRMVYGRTDKGRSGMKAFFASHHCTKICKMLHLSAHNKMWSREWRQESTQSTNFRQND